MTEHRIGPADDIDAGEHIVVEVNGRDVGVFNVNDEYFALLSWCPHQGGPLCEGPTGGTIEEEFDPDSLTTSKTWAREGEVVTCPWHGWEFDVTSGQCLSKRDLALPTYDIESREGTLYLEF